MVGELSSASFGFHPESAAAPTSRAARMAAEAVAVGVDYLIAQAGGADAVLRATSRKLPRVLRQANMIELTEAITMTLVELAPDALEQLADARWHSLEEASRLLARRASSPRSIV